MSHAPPSRRMQMLQRHLANAMEIEVFNLRKCPLSSSLLYYSNSVIDICLILPIAKPEIHGVVEDEEVKYHYVYVCRKIQS